MNDLASLMLESAIVNTVPIFLAAGIFSLVGGPFLKKLAVGDCLRGLVYSLAGVAAGLWSYSVFDVPGRSIEAPEITAVGLGMLAYCLIVIMPIVGFKSRGQT